MNHLTIGRQDAHGPLSTGGDAPLWGTCVSVNLPWRISKRCPCARRRFAFRYGAPQRLEP